MNTLFHLIVLILCIIGRLETVAIPHKQARHSSGQMMLITDKISDIPFSVNETQNVTLTTCGSTLCENVNEYQIAHVDSLLKKSTNKHEHLYHIDSLVPDLMIADRFNGNNEEQPLCGSVERVIYPRSGQTKDQEWLLLVNDENFKQGVRVEECIHKEKCEMTQSFPFGYDTKCKQKYIYRQLLAVSKDGTTTVKELFKIPSCCQCVLIRNLT